MNDDSFLKKTKIPYVAKEADAQGYVTYTDAENQVWETLIKRQTKLVQTHACKAYLDGLAHLNLPTDHVPQCAEINARLKETTGWSVAPVPAIIPADYFFSLLMEKKFPAALFVRRVEELDYLEEPDIFHEYFGHCPLLTDPIYANFMQKYGELSLKATPQIRDMLARLYWFTVEFGLIKTPEDASIKCYGGGILSSYEETRYALENTEVKRKKWDPLEALRTPYRIDIKQPIYFVINDFSQIYDLLNQDIMNLIETAFKLGEFPPEYPTS